MTEPKITVIPPNKAPKQLTAFAFVKTLREHAMAYWNAKNPNGMAPTEVIEPAATLTPVKQIKPTYQPKWSYDPVTAKEWLAELAKTPLLLALLRKTVTLQRKHVCATHVNYTSRALTLSEMSDYMAESRASAASLSQIAQPLRDDEYLARRQSLYSAML